MGIMTRVPVSIRRMGGMGAVAVAGALAVPMLAAATPANAAGVAAADAPVASITYDYSPDYQSFTVPAGVDTLYIVMDGGSGADGQGSNGGGSGQPGGEVRGDLTVTPGEVLTLWAGGAGQPGGGEGYGDPAHDDFEGGSGGSGWGAGDGAGGGGGAASYLKVGSKVVMVAGGGGGGGGSGDYLAGTSTAGGNGSSGGYYPAADPAHPATYGTTDNGGSASSKEGGAGGAANGTLSDNGSAGYNADGSAFGGGGGGGGGGGYYTCDGSCWSSGAGGIDGVYGFGGGGGAGGSSFADPSLTGVSFGTSGLSASTAGQVTIQYGEAGSSTSSTTVTSSTDSVPVGQPVTFHAFVDPTDGGGTVTFTSNGQVISGCASLPFISGGGTDWEAACTTSSLTIPPVGADTITATYSGDSAYTGSSGSTNETVTPDTTSTTLTASPSGIYSGASVTLTASVSGGDGGGVIDFVVAGASLPGCGAVRLTAYKATCTATWPVPVSNPAKAVYSGDQVASPSSGSVNVTVLPPAFTTTSVSLSSAGVVYGQEQAEKVSVTVSSSTGTPNGTAVVLGSPGPAGPVCMITLASGSGSCTIPATEFPAGTAALQAGYLGTAEFGTSSSGVVTFTVSRAATTTALSLSPTVVAYGGEQAEKVSATVTSPAGTPGGTVTVRSGTTTICTITLASGKGTCSPAAAPFAAGTATLTATYNGSTDFGPSASAAVPLTISRAATTTTLSLSPAKETYGDEQTERVSASVTSPAGTPGGTVTVRSGTTTICTITLASGKGTCSPAATRFPVSTDQLIATYNGGANFGPSTSGAKTLTVAKATTKTTLSLSATTVTYGREQAERLTVSVAPQYGGTPTGKVTIKSGTVTVCTITLASGKGSCTLSAAKLPAGARTLIATYNGSSNFTSSASAKKTLTVKK